MDYDENMIFVYYVYINVNVINSQMILFTSQ